MEQLKNIKVIFIDIDRTLTNDNHKIPKLNIEAIKEATQKGILVVLCSGRWLAYAKEKSIEAFASNYIITNNGAQIYDYLNKKSIYENKMSNENVEKLLKDFEEMGIECILNTSSTRFGSKKLVRKIYEGEHFFYTLDDIGNENVLQIVGEVNSFQDMDKMVRCVNKYDEFIILNLSKAYLENKRNEKNYYADINNRNTNKGQGIKKFLEIFNINKDEAICFGDYINDIDMFNECGHKVAMKNASEELKQKANYITLSNNEGGVGDFIKKYIL